MDSDTYIARRLVHFARFRKGIAPLLVNITDSLITPIYIAGFELYIAGFFVHIARLRKGIAHFSVHIALLQSGITD